MKWKLPRPDWCSWKLKKKDFFTTIWNSCSAGQNLWWFLKCSYTSPIYFVNVMFSANIQLVLSTKRSDDWHQNMKNSLSQREKARTIGVYTWGGHIKGNVLFHNRKLEVGSSMLNLLQHFAYCIFCLFPNYFLFFSKEINSKCLLSFWPYKSQNTLYCCRMFYMFLQSLLRLDRKSVV